MKRIILPIILIFFYACTKTVTLPNATESSVPVAIVPDYTDITIPPNIAPLNFLITDSTTSDAIVEIKGNRTILLQGKTVCIDTATWHNLLSENKGRDLTYTIYTCKEGTWVRHPSFYNHIAEEEIDPYISYRLIEPSYMAYKNLGIYQRDLRNYREDPIYENSDGDHCINCHTYQNRHTERMLFHVRGKNGCTVFANGNDIKTVNTKAGQMFSSCVYPSWHPFQNKVVFSTNKTGQYFFTLNPEKVEVVDDLSDLVMYDVTSDVITPIIGDSLILETFPTWAPSGDRLYYCQCSSLKDDPEYKSGDFSAIGKKYDSLKYDIWSMSYDTLTCTFGEPRPEFLASAIGKSATLPRISPDGRYILFTLGDHGQFHIWHRSSDLYIKDLTTGVVSPLTAANSNDVESFHTWSSNGRWIVFSSRRDDGSYTRPYFTYFDSLARKPFILPQENPEMNLLRMKSYNLPEFMTEPVTISPENFRQKITAGKTNNATMKLK